MNLWRSVAGSLEIALTTADPEGLFCMLTDAGITLEKFRQTDMLTYTVTIVRQDYRKTVLLCKKHGACLHIQKKNGLYWFLKKQVFRPLFGGSMLLLFLI